MTRITAVAGRILMNRRGGGRVLTGNASQSTIDIRPTPPVQLCTTTACWFWSTATCRPRAAAVESSLAKRPRGKVVSLERARTQVVGTLEKSRSFGLSCRTTRRISHDIYLPKYKRNRRGDSGGGDHRMALALQRAGRAPCRGVGQRVQAGRGRGVGHSPV